MALEAIGPPPRVAMVGDRIASDIAGGRAAGLATVLVLSGTSGRAEAEAADRRARPRAREPRRPAAVSGDAAAAGRPRPGLSFAGALRGHLPRPGRGRRGAAGPAALRARAARRRRPRGRDRDRRLRDHRPAAAAGRRAARRPLGAQADGDLLGTLLLAASGLLYLPNLGIAGLIFARLVLGVGEGSLYTAGSAWIVDMAPLARRGRVLGLYGLAVWGGLSVGPLVGELLLDSRRLPRGLDLRRGAAAARGADRDPGRATRSSRSPTPSRTR